MYRSQESRPKSGRQCEDAEDAASRVKLYLLQPMCHTPLGSKDKGFGFALFLHAFPSYALGAAVTKQLEYVDAMQHSSNCISIANSSKAEGRTTLLAVIYDAKSRSRVCECVCVVVLL